MDFGNRDLAWWLHSGGHRLEQINREMEKLIEYRVNCIVGDPQMMKVYEKFGGGVFRRSSIFHGLAKFLEQSNVHGNLCFEVGSWNGLTALVLARHFREVVSVDIAHNPLKHEIAAYLGVRNIQFVDIDSNDQKEVVLRRLKIDFAYLDGDHANDTDADFNLVRHGGRVLFHECWPFQPPVWDLVNTFPERQVTRGGFGLALWDATK